MTDHEDGNEIQRAVRERYAQAARQAQGAQRASCCSSAGCCCSTGDSHSAKIYDIRDLREIPEAAALASLGCGNPLLLAALQPGETVLDLGSGGGIDVLLSAKRVGPAGKAYGLDMTDEMLELARANARQSGVTNVEFLKGQIERVPLPDAHIDVLISNCVINLSADKDAVLAEAYRVLKPGGRFAVADIVVQGKPLPARLRETLSLWTSCISGALTEDEYRDKLAAAGFVQVEVQVLQEYGPEQIAAELQGGGTGELELDPGSRIVSAFIKAGKPA